MKKLRVLLMLACALIVVSAMSSCKSKTIFYRICGYYIELVDVEKLSVDDKNPKIYFKYSQNDIFSTYAGSMGTFQNTAKIIKEESDVIKHYFTGDLVLSSGTYENIKIHLIILKEGKYVVETEVYDTIKKTGTVKCSYKYTYLSQKYEIDFVTNIKERG